MSDAAAPQYISNYLPSIHGMARDLRHGRSPYEGTQRGWGLQYGDLRSRVLADPLYQEAAAMAAGRTLVADDNRMNIFLIMRFFLGALPGGHIIEFGSYRGGNAIFMAHVCRVLHPGMRVYSLDTFAGMPATDKSIDAHNAHDFRDARFEDFTRYAAEQRLDNLVIVRGLFEDTAVGALEDAGTIRMAHIDCDIASAVAYSYETVRPRMVRGGYLVIDDATVSSCLGATEVVEELLIRRDRLHAEQIWPHYVFRYSSPA